MTVLMFSDIAAHASALAWVDAKRAHLMGDKAKYAELTERARRLENAAVASRCRSAGVVPLRSQTSFAVDGDCA
jgi:hypothetical protein